MNGFTRRLRHCEPCKRRVDEGHDQAGPITNMFEQLHNRFRRKQCRNPSTAALPDDT